MKMSIELPVATRHRRDMPAKLLKTTFNQNKQTNCFNVRNSCQSYPWKPHLTGIFDSNTACPNQRQRPFCFRCQLNIYALLYDLVISHRSVESIDS